VVAVVGHHGIIIATVDRYLVMEDIIKLVAVYQNQTLPHDERVAVLHQHPNKTTKIKHRKMTTVLIDRRLLWERN
jgi:hypothetical protein